MNEYADCWTYAKEAIDEKFKETGAKLDEIGDILDALTPITDGASSVVIGDTAICYGVITLESVTTSNLQQDVELPVSYKDGNYAVIVTNNTFYDSNLDVAGVPKNKNTFVLWAKAVSTTHTDAVISWVTIGKTK